MAIGSGPVCGFLEWPPFNGDWCTVEAAVGNAL